MSFGRRAHLPRLRIITPSAAGVSDPAGKSAFFRLAAARVFVKLPATYSDKTRGTAQPGSVTQSADRRTSRFLVAADVSPAVGVP